MSIPNKTPIKLSQLVLEGLGHLGTTIPIDISKKIISNSVKLTLHPEASKLFALCVKFCK